jgi:hypothetical protein
MRTAIAATAVCVLSWLGLLIGAGNVGLQRAVAIGPTTLLEVPLALALAAGSAVIVGTLAGRSGVSAFPLLGAVLVGDLIGAALLAPILVGEVELVHAPDVFVAITALGLQPLGALIGAYVARRA